MPRKVIANTPEFQAMWMDRRLTLDHIGRHYGRSGAAISKAAKQFGLPSRRSYAHVPDCSEFKNMWHGDYLVSDIAAAFGVSEFLVHKSAAHHGYGARGSGRVAVPQGMAQLAPHPFFTVHHDKRIFSTSGAYRALEALADEWRKPLLLVQQRWHKLRVE